MGVQNQDEMIKQGRLAEPYKGVIDCFKRTIADEGVGPLWRGNLANCLRYFPTQALNFAFKDKIKAQFKASKQDSKLTTLGKNVAAGGAAGAMSLMFVYSLDYARTRLANDNKSAKKGGERQFNGLVDVYKKTLASDGFAGLYRGFCISCVGIVVYRGFYFGLYDTIKPLMLRDDVPFIVSFGLGYAVTVTAGILSYPIDTIRRRMMMTSGAGANVLRGMAGAGVLAGFDKVKAFYIKMRETSKSKTYLSTIWRAQGRSV